MEEERIEEQQEEPTSDDELAKGFSEEEISPEAKEKEAEEEKKEEEIKEEEVSEEEEPGKEEPTDWQARGKELEEKLEAQQKEIDELKKGKEEESEKKEFIPEEMPETVKEYFEGEPAAKEAIDYAIRNGVGQTMAEIFGSADVNELKEQVTNLATLFDNVSYAFNFESIVMGGYYDETKDVWIDGHLDARKISRSKEWADWIKAKGEKDKTYAENINPKRAIGIISEFKEEMAKKAAKEHDRIQKKKSKQTKETIEEPVDLSKGSGPLTKEKSSEDELLAGFQEEL